MEEDRGRIKVGAGGERKPAITIILSGLPSLTLVFAFVICLGVSSKGTKNRISHCSKRLNSLRLGSREHNNFNEIKVSQGQYLFQLILTVTHCLPGQNPRALTHIQKIAEKKDGIVGRQLPNARGASHLPLQFGSHSLRLLPDPPVRGLSKRGGTQCLSHLTAGKLRPREEE